MCFLCLEERRKAQKFSRQRAKTQKSHLSLALRGAWGYKMHFSRRLPQKSSNRVDLDTLGKILIFSF